MKAVIIGGGLGGLATALRLRASGWEVTVCEAGPSFGGKMNRLSQAGYSFDTGPSLITLPDVFAELYTAAGARLEDRISLVRVDPHADYLYPDGTRITCSADPDLWRTEIARIEPRDLAGFDKLQALGRDLYKVSRETFFRHSPRSRPGLSDLKALRHLPIRHGWGNYAATVAQFLRSPYLRQFYNRYPTYVGSSPYLSPATLLLIPYMEREFGAWYVRGGLYAIVESLVGLARERGIELFADTRVAAIETAGKRATGVRLGNGSHVACDVVVMNGDAAQLPEMLSNQPRPDPRARSMSGFVVMLGVRSRPAGLAHHTVLFSSDYRAEFDDLFTRRQFPAEPTVYISAPGASDASVAPPGGDALFVMANAPADGETWTPGHTVRALTAIRARLAQAKIDTGLAEVCEVFDPGLIFRRYLAPGGAIYGTHSHGWRHAFLRPANRSSIRGLYLVGGSTHPGGGTPTVLMSARITAEAIESDAGRL